jgi:hypothetical protein
MPFVCMVDCQALKLEPLNVKCLFRRAKAWDGMNEPEKALQDLKLVCNIAALLMVAF